MRRFGPGLLALALGCGRGDLLSPQPERRAAAVAALSGSRSDADWTPLLAAQDDPSALVRKAAAGALTARGGPRAVEALGKLARDPDLEVAVAAARGLSAQPKERRAPLLLAEAWWQAPAAARPELASALHQVGGSAREVVETEARRLWERNVRALSQGGPAARAGAAEELGRSGRADAVRLLLPLLEPGAPALQAAAARGLGLAGDRGTRQALEKLLGSPDAEVAEAAAGALAALGDPAAADALASLARTGPERLALAAVEALGHLPQAPEVGVGLCEVALRAPTPAVAARAARRARQRDADCPGPPLVARLQRRGTEALAALAAAAELRLPPERSRELGDRILPLLAGGGGEPGLRVASAIALGALAHGPAASVVARRAAELRTRRAEPEELAALALAAARLRAAGAEALALDLAGDPAPPLRAAAAEALGALGALPAAAALLQDAAPEVRLAAARALARPGAPVAPLAAAAKKAAGDEDLALLGALARALAESGAPEAAAPLGSLLEGPGGAAAAAALGRLGAREGAPLLAARLASGVARGREEAVEALGQLGGAEAGPALARELWSERHGVRAAAARALGRLRHEPAAPWLEALRSDYCGEVRRAAVEALARLPSERRR